MATSWPSSAPAAITAVGWILVFILVSRRARGTTMSSWIPGRGSILAVRPSGLDHREREQRLAHELAADGALAAHLRGLALHALSLDLDPQLVPGLDRR